MLFDVHIHSQFSPDSNSKIIDIIENSQKLNIGITLTDHLDFDFEGSEYFPLIDIENYLHTYLPYKNNKVNIGIEMGLSQESYYKNLNFYNNFKDKLDMIIGSIHSINGNDLYYSLKNDTRSKKNIYREYFENMYSNIKNFDFFNTLGHIDYICRYAPFDNAEIYYKDFNDYLDEIFKLIINKNKVIELNTARLNNKHALESMIEIYSRYKYLGGEFVTLGSDSHLVEHLGRNFEEAKYLLEKTSLKSCYFVNRHLKTI